MGKNRKSKPSDAKKKPTVNPAAGKPGPMHATIAEQTHEANESEKAKRGVQSTRERMVKIGRGNQQSGRQGQ